MSGGNQSDVASARAEAAEPSGTSPVSGATLEDAVRVRRSVRGFFPDREVPEEELRRALELAQRAPSNCNVQPWRVFVTRGAATARVRRALLAGFDSGDLGEADDPIDTFPGEYRALQVACAVELYGHMGVGRHDAEGRMRATRRNFELFDAPHLAVVCMEKYFGIGVALDVGTWVQTFMLALAARGIGSCPQAALRSAAGILRRELGIREDLRVLCGISFGYEDPAVPANATRQPRQPLERNVTFIDA